MSSGETTYGNEGDIGDELGGGGSSEEDGILVLDGVLGSGHVGVGLLEVLCKARGESDGPPIKREGRASRTVETYEKQRVSTGSKDVAENESNVPYLAAP